MNTVTNANPAFSDTGTTLNSPPEASPLGWWKAVSRNAADDFLPAAAAIRQVRDPLYVLDTGDGETAFASHGSATLGNGDSRPDGLPMLAYTPALLPETLGDPTFTRDYNLRYAYMTGSMANGIASTELVKAIVNSGMLGSFGAAGLGIDEIESAILDLKTSLGERTFASNLIHSPNEKGHEDKVVDLYLKHGIQLVEASAYLKLTPAVVRYRVTGVHEDANGNVIAPNRIIAKASRVEVARHWFSPPPANILAELEQQRLISRDEARLAGSIPMAQDLTVEADSGGHTDNRPAITLIPTMIALRDRLQEEFGYRVSLRVGAAGGISTPASAAAAFSMGAAYIVTGTVNQACVESGSSDTVRRMLADAGQADVAMAPAVDMFEMGVKLQVLKRGTMFAMRGNKLYEVFRGYETIDRIPGDIRESLEKTIFKAPMETIWKETREFFSQRDPSEVTRAERDPKHKLALICRWYLGLSSRWANTGKTGREVDYQVWCGPAMGAFNEWTKGSFLADPGKRNVVIVALNLVYGAAVVTRINQLRQQGISLDNKITRIDPMEYSEIEDYLN